VTEAAGAPPHGPPLGADRETCTYQHDPASAAVAAGMVDSACAAASR
jgi:hypothetical protein